MKFDDLPLKRKLRRLILLTTSAVLILTCSAYSVYEFLTFRQTTINELTTLGKIISANSTAALAFQDEKAAEEILSAVAADPRIVAASLYNADGQLFTHYPKNSVPHLFSGKEDQRGYYRENFYLIGYEPVLRDNRQLGTLFLRCDMGPLYERFLLYVVIAIIVAGVSLFAVYMVSMILQRQIIRPIRELASTAQTISTEEDYSARAVKAGNDEIGLLTDAFNQMLDRIEEQTKEITSLNQSLEQRIKERTQELLAANRELEAFSYSVSHDLRAPLRSIHGYMNIFSEDYLDQLDDEGKRLVNICIQNARRMGQLIDDLLAFSRLGRTSLRMTLLPMHDIVKSVLDEQGLLDRKPNIAVKLHHLPAALADRVTIKQVWYNLIANALKYSMKKSHITIEIGAKDEEEDIVYFVKDNGAGFDMKYYDKLFGVFQRLHSQEEFEGTGVGLAIVQRIIARHGGELWAAGEEGKGATFYFSLKKD